MNELAQRLSGLSPEQRRLLELKLKRQNINIDTLRLMQNIGGSKQALYTAMVPVEEKEYYSLSSAQERFYLLHHMDSETQSYNMTGLMIMEGELNKQQFEEAFRKLIERHESLRTSFEMKDNETVQRIHHEVPFEIDYFDSGNREEDLIETFIRPFDLKQAPLLRLGLVRLEEKKHILMFDMHHIISDGASMNLLIKDFSAFYSGEQPHPLRLRCKDYCEWQQNVLNSGQLKKQQEYWLNHFSGEIPVLNMSTDCPRPEIQSFAGDTIRFYFEEELTRRLNQLMRETKTTLFMVLLAFYNIVLSKYTVQEDIIIGLPIAGRNHKDLENIIGLFMETLAVRNYPGCDKSFEEFLEEVRENTLNAFENQVYPFKELIKHVGVENDPGRSPLFDAMLIVQNQNIEGNLEEIEIEKLKMVPYEGAAPQPAKVDIGLEAESKKNRIFFKLKYCTTLFKRETMERFITFFREVASTAVDNKKIKLKDIKISHDLVTTEANVYKTSDSEFEF
ncbi:MAG: hypothetical protein GTO45_26995 [Candidatus Aminicenantes bacterium]|nr:hypothetical protein [Candidatus Aminicenantes bacterium]NIM82431.1 hypothetical protein [Candidatus Aminicenantes bacterium]NIN21792.1 hypothetical protein [Candidatus Aminicenantes bacterium]NIN45584.1 hypothetical protein [Candidatus Aminicenantes bacterium]NIN88415.1 hypothetical protein [Candidatus Aminicenantes bacterium]